MTSGESLAESLLKAYGQVIYVEGLGQDFEARGAGTDGFTLLHKRCWRVVGRFGEQAQSDAIAAAQKGHECPALSSGAGVE
ncbi:hypothetical protein A2875_00140 [Candidatus Gottesmanbacteria bacterium RIFCSPHIGHO2_01_FULL_46_14]|uniref:Uncharacterized protein n=2 Tax=Candidatus Gottesmaniibacteriota TaxID=1752720 RepID=A0A1F5ZKS6_9BACT|nr:MAG: hypothetical protein A2875_00140 [Candidatus Gottesmanbacteria bacterium RIFCSPHIGHO2_01_FULL_46_14]OGG29017.1 MAG: hypothetical protein A2971_03280 [Candidatus Gottesmanbacteria bacterium RIFCSPLOWO2_01_FULL_46_21]